jgi:hypothetical protein
LNEEILYQEAKMPRYFFDLNNGSGMHDEEGQEFDVPASAKAHAERVARELAEETTLHDAEVVVRDSQGEFFRIKVARG